MNDGTRTLGGVEAAIVDHERSTDANLRRRVEALLRACGQSESLLDRSIVGLAADGILPSRDPKITVERAPGLSRPSASPPGR